MNPVDRDRPPVTHTEGDRAVVKTTQRRVQVCQHTTCLKDGSAALLQTWQALPLSDVAVVASGCLGNCGNGPTVLVLPDEVLYSRARSSDLQAMLTPPLQRNPVTERLKSNGQTDAAIAAERSQKVALSLVGLAVLLILLSLGWTLYGLL